MEVEGRLAELYGLVVLRNILVHLHLESFELEEKRKRLLKVEEDT